jgi:hypothetical protein
MNERSYILLVGARGGATYGEGEEILGPNILGPFAAREDAEDAALIVAANWAHADAKWPFGEPYAEVREITAPTERALYREGENWVALEACDEFDKNYATNTSACLTCGFSEWEHPTPDAEEADEEDDA